jgi:ADP-heptose:LPS heptosyltransferase
MPQDAEIYYIDKEVGHKGCIDLGEKIETWEDTLDFIDQMDCVISSCTSLVHAAGAMGKTCFVVVPIAEYYIWSTSRRDTTTPWYGNNFQVHKQTKVRDWHEPLTNVKQEVIKLMRQNNE